MKQCCKCKKWKNETKFVKDKNYKNGFSSKCKECNKEESSLYRSLHKEKVKITKEKNQKKWILFLSKNPKCEICGKKLQYLSGNFLDSVHFDHRNEGKEKIKGHPSNWLSFHSQTPENSKIWQSCNFGVLCNKCNRMLPTYNRKKWLEKVIRYVKKIT